jgi:hypothetical protein
MARGEPPLHPILPACNQQHRTARGAPGQQLRRMSRGRHYMAGGERGDDRRGAHCRRQVPCPLAGVRHRPPLTRDRPPALPRSATVRCCHDHAANCVGTLAKRASHAQHTSQSASFLAVKPTGDRRIVMGRRLPTAAVTAGCAPARCPTREAVRIQDAGPPALGKPRKQRRTAAGPATRATVHAPDCPAHHAGDDRQRCSRCPDFPCLPRAKELVLLGPFRSRD